MLSVLLLVGALAELEVSAPLVGALAEVKIGAPLWWRASGGEGWRAAGMGRGRRRRLARCWAGARAEVEKARRWGGALAELEGGAPLGWHASGGGGWRAAGLAR